MDAQRPGLCGIHNPWLPSRLWPWLSSKQLKSYHPHPLVCSATTLVDRTVTDSPSAAVVECLNSCLLSCYLLPASSYSYPYSASLSFVPRSLLRTTRRLLCAASFLAKKQTIPEQDFCCCVSQVATVFCLPCGFPIFEGFGAAAAFSLHDGLCCCCCHRWSWCAHLRNAKSPRPAQAGQC